MERYLLFDSGCSTCSKVAQAVEKEAGGWLAAHSLHDPEMQKLLNQAKPDWHWQPTLLEVDGSEAKATTGVALAAKMVTGLGPQRAWRIAALVHEHKGEGDSNHKGRRRFLRRSGALLASLPLIGIPSLRNGLSAVVTDELRYQIYKDPDFGFTLQYPVGWQAEVKEQQPTPLIDDEAILKRVIFSSQPALVYLDIWLTKGKNFADWLDWYKETRLVEQMITAPNATVAGQPAATFLQNHQRDLMLTYFSDGEYVYRLMNWMTGDPTHLDAYWHMLDTFNLPGVDSLATVEIPLWVRQEEANSVKRSMGMLMVSNCCGHNSSGNPFPCCGCDECCGCEQEGNCTWWCYFKHGYVPFSGNAGTWWGQAGDHATWYQSSYPPTNGDMSIACWSGDPGHVAHTNSWSGTGNVSITEMSWCTHCDESDSIPYTDPTQGWLYDSAV